MMRLSMFLAAWHMCLSPGASLMFPQIRASIERRLFAKDPELNSLLQEYRKATGRVTVDKTPPVVDAVSPVVDISPPVVDISPPAVDVPPTPTTVMDVQAAVSKLTIQDSVATKKSYIAEAFSRTTPSSGKAPTLAEWLTHSGSQVENQLRDGDPSLVAPPIDASNFNRVANFNEKLAIMKQNLIDFANGIKQLSPGENVLFDTEKVTAFTGKVAAAASATSGAASFDFHNLISKLNLEQYGAWYVVILTFVWGLLQRKAGKAEIEDAFRVELAKAQEKANEAAEFATIAGQSARTTKRMVYNADNDANKIVLEATKAKVLQMDMEQLKRDADKLRAETRLLQENLMRAEAKAAKVAELEAKLLAAEAQVNVVAAPAPEAESVPEVTPKAKQIQQTAAPTFPIPVSEPISDSPVAESIVDAVEPAPDVTVVDAVESVPDFDVAPVTESAPDSAPGIEISESAVDTGEAASEVIVAPVAEFVFEAAPEIEISETVEPRAPLKVTKGDKAPIKKAIKKTKAVKKVNMVKSAIVETAPPVETPPPDAINGDASWASLSEASLKRKTVKELSDFLATRGISATDGEGNALKKAQLLETVQKLL